MKVVREDYIYSMTNEKLLELWNYCKNLLETWEGDDEVLQHSECFLVGYCILLFNQMKLKGLNPNPKMMREALSKRLSEDEINRVITIGKDISKRGIPIYRNLI